MVWNTPRGASSPEKPTFIIPDPLSITMGALSPPSSDAVADPDMLLCKVLLLFGFLSSNNAQCCYIKGAKNARLSKCAPITRNNGKATRIAAESKLLTVTAADLGVDSFTTGFCRLCCETLFAFQSKTARKCPSLAFG